MSLLIIQLSDLHVRAGAEAVFKHLDVLCRAVAAEIDDDTEACLIIFNGDAAFGGKAEEFKGAHELLKGLRIRLNLVRPALPVHVLLVPGNHDCDLTSEDSEARLTLRRNVTSKVPTPSVARVLLAAQAEYFKFAEPLSPKGACLTEDSPYYRFFDLPLKAGLVRVHLLNSSWTSVLSETDDLRYPLEAFSPPAEPEAYYAVAVVHHPVHWFLMPGVRRELRDLLESHADLILTGHEHENEASRRVVLEGGDISYIEGGVLSDHQRLNLCTFNVIRLDLSHDKQLIKRFELFTDHFEPVGNPEESSLQQNRLRVDRQLRLTAQFEEWLDELEDPLTHPREEDLRLSHLFAYPDLRKVVSVGNSSDAEEGKASELVERVKSEAVTAELSTQTRSMLIGGDKVGKTSILKRLFADFHHAGLVPLFIKGGDIVRSGNINHLRRQIEVAVKQQYQLLTPAAFEQLPKEKKVLLVDDFQDAPMDAQARKRVVEFIDERFGKSILAASADFYIELLGRRDAEDAAPLLLHQRYEVAEFGKQRFEELALRWTTLGRADQDPVQLRTTALELCDKVHSLIAAAGLPHTPWLLAVILEHDESPDATIAAKNGDYGHLYHAVITVRLAKSKFTRFNLNGKFTYLSELAYYLYKNKHSVLNSQEARQFHADHLSRFDLTLDYEQVRDDLIDTRMLRQDGDELAFRHKYVYSFFIAYWLSRNIHRNETQVVVHQLCQKLHHDVSANVLVFLSHLTDHPIVLQEMQTAAGKFFENSQPATMANDIAALNGLDGVEGFFTLPPTAPEINRKLLLDAEDERRAKERDLRLHDGRAIAEIDEEQEEQAEAHSTIREIRASLRTIRILGQVLRNKALSMEGQDKVTLMEQVVMLERRLLGYLYGFLQDIDEMILSIRKRLMRLFVEAKQKEKREAAERDGTVTEASSKGFLPRPELRELWNEAEVLANRFWFDMYWLGSFGLSKRVASAIGSRELDSTLAKIKAKDGTLPVQLVELASRLHRRTPTIPVDELVELHKRLSKEGNKLARVVLEAIVWERLLLFDTDVSQKQAICKQMGIDVPVQSLDLSRRKFLLSHASKATKGKS